MHAAIDTALAHSDVVLGTGPAASCMASPSGCEQGYSIHRAVIDSNMLKLTYVSYRWCLNDMFAREASANSYSVKDM